MKHPVIWFEVTGKDQNELQSFYAELFGWSVSTDNPTNYGMVKTGSEQGIQGGIGATLEGKPPHLTFYVASDDVAGSLARAGELGGKTLMEATQLPGGPEIGLFADPAGNLVGVVCEPA